MCCIQNWDLLITPRAINDVLETQKEDVQKWFDEIKSKLANTKISVTDRIIVSVSSIVGEIIGFADKEKVDLIILGPGKNWIQKIVTWKCSRGCSESFIMSCNGSKIITSL